MVKSNAFTGGAIAGLTSTENIVMAAGKGIDFSATANAPNMSSEVFDDYEEGQLTATFTCSTSGTITLSNSILQYTKIGRMVHVSGLLVVGSVSAPIGAIEIPLPYAVATGLANFGNRSLGVVSVNASAVGTTLFTLQASEGLSTMTLYRGDGVAIAASSANVMSGDESVLISISYIAN